MEQQKNCWSNKTPLETGLLLILIVAVPFLIAMVTIYTILLLQNCPNCSMKCDTLCSKRMDVGVLPRFLELNPNISMSRLAEKYEICPDSMLKDFEPKVDHAFVASILQDVYEDEVNEQRYLCAGAIVTFKWVVTSSKCLRTKNENITNNYGIYVRAGSNYWTQGGSEHEVKRVVFADPTILATVAAIELKSEFPKLPSIRPIMLSRSSLYKHLAVAEMYGWKTNDSLPLKFRLKYLTMDSEPMIAFRDSDCEEESGKQPHLFCATAVKPEGSCSYRMGFPVTRARILIGVDVGEYCDMIKNITVHLIYDISYALRWLEKLTKVYVEHI